MMPQPSATYWMRRLRRQTGVISINPFARVCLVASSCVIHSAWAEKPIITSVTVSQSSVSSASSHNTTSALRATYLLGCRGSVCTGRLPLVLEQHVYYYDAAATLLVEGGVSIRVSINLHPVVPGCGPRSQPSLTAIFTSIPLVGSAHVTVPVKQYGNFDPSTSSQDMNDAVYQVRKEPVAYPDVSIELR